jgi:predicted secreted protein
MRELVVLVATMAMMACGSPGRETGSAHTGSGAAPTPQEPSAKPAVSGNAKAARREFDVALQAYRGAYEAAYALRSSATEFCRAFQPAPALFERLQEAKPPEYHGLLAWREALGEAWPHDLRGLCSEQLQQFGGGQPNAVLADEIEDRKKKLDRLVEMAKD